MTTYHNHPYPPQVFALASVEPHEEDDEISLYIEQKSTSSIMPSLGESLIDDFNCGIDEEPWFDEFTGTKWDRLTIRGPIIPYRLAVLLNEHLEGTSVSPEWPVTKAHAAFIDHLQRHGFVKREESLGLEADPKEEYQESGMQTAEEEDEPESQERPSMEELLRQMKDMRECYLLTALRCAMLKLKVAKRSFRVLEEEFKDKDQDDILYKLRKSQLFLRVAEARWTIYTTQASMVKHGIQVPSTGTFRKRVPVDLAGAVEEWRRTEAKLYETIEKLERRKQEDLEQLIGPGIEPVESDTVSENDPIEDDEGGSTDNESPCEDESMGEHRELEIEELEPQNLPENAVVEEDLHEDEPMSESEESNSEQRLEGSPMRIVPEGERQAANKPATSSEETETDSEKSPAAAAVEEYMREIKAMRKSEVPEEE